MINSRVEKHCNFFVLIGFGSLLIIVYNVLVSKPIFIYKTYYKMVIPKSELYCHFLKTEDTLPELQNTEVRKDESIFFVETSCNSYFNGKVFIEARQACAVESAALMNQNRTIFLLYASPGYFHDDKTESDRLIKNLMSYSNIKILYLNMGSFIKNTPVESLWSSGQIQKSKYIVTHTSDILRILLLWKYGGIYLDLDVVVVQTLENLPINFVGAEDNKTIASSVLSFTKEGLGHQHINACIHDISEHFDGSRWGANGPEAISRLLSSLCNTGNVSKMINRVCKGVKVFPTNAFSSIYWKSWVTFFNETDTEYVNERTKDSYLIHLWNKLSHDTRIPLYQNVPYYDFARKYCPGTIFNLEEYF